MHAVVFDIALRKVNACFEPPHATGRHAAAVEIDAGPMMFQVTKGEGRFPMSTVLLLTAAVDNRLPP